MSSVSRSWSRGWWLLVLVLAAWKGVDARAAAPEKSVVQIVNFSQQPVWDAPWRFDSVRKDSGSGFVIRGHRILTNAHVVSWARQILVLRYQDPRPYEAHVAYVGHDCDLAVLEVQDPSFFDGLEPLEVGPLPEVRSSVVTYGYPAGGDQISYTRGVVSRIEVQTYVHIGNRSLLVAQTDAAINPGNSGGPVIQNDQVVGVAFQNMPGLENTGFFIPPPVIEHFLKDIADGTYDGVPQAGIRLAPLQNPAYRRFLRLPPDQPDAGARIDSLWDFPETQRLLSPDDVLLQVGPYPVGSDGTILYHGNRVNVACAFEEAQAGDKLPLRIWRDGAETNLELAVEVNHTDRAQGNQYDRLPRYFIYGGLVFTPLSLDLFKRFGTSRSASGNAESLYELFYRRYEDPKHARPEPIMLATTLAHSVNANTTIKAGALVDRINGRRINRLEDVIQAFQSPSGPEDIIEFLPDDAFECLDRAAVAKANAAILRLYGITADRRL